MNSPAKILLIEDDMHAAAALRQVLGEEGYEVTVATRGDTGLELTRGQPYDVVITDFKLPGMDGLALVRQLHTLHPRLPVILMTAHGTTETAIEATKLGAYDYLLKPFEMDEFLDMTARAVASSRTMTSPVALGETGAAKDAIIGQSRAMQNVFKQVGRVAATTLPVLIRGETGTGKELIARAIYQHSDRAGQPFIAVNCAAIPETLLESELFGHERGAFTGAEMRRIGRFEQADRGTIFLDEIGDMSISTQAKLLRVLQEKSIQRLGAKEPVAIDVRVIAATHRDLETAIQERLFREDLFYRINVVAILLPALREHREDIPALIEYFLRRYGIELGINAPSIQPDAVEFLQQQPWRGNVRELENVVRKALLAARGYAIVQADLREVMREPKTESAARQTLAEYASQLLDAAQRGESEGVYAEFHAAAERELFSQAMRLAEGNKTKAARWLGIARLTLREKLNTLGIEVDEK
ncbi:MAG: glnG 5 [Chthoniobacteraceae bacterium]|nr:glnG 5 [Chthoniobacteraceae bacterium]